MKLFQGVDCVYHMAAYGMSGREQVYFIVTKNAKEIHALEGYLAPSLMRQKNKSCFSTISSEGIGVASS